MRAASRGERARQRAPESAAAPLITTTLPEKIAPCHGAPRRARAAR